MYGFEKEGITDRSYRLTHNQKQNQMDKFSLVGSALGGLAFQNTLGLGFGRGAGVGFAFGTLAWITKEVVSNLRRPHK